MMVYAPVLYCRHSVVCGLCLWWSWHCSYIDSPWCQCQPYIAPFFPSHLCKRVPWCPVGFTAAWKWRWSQYGAPQPSIVYFGTATVSGIVLTLLPKCCQLAQVASTFHSSHLWQPVDIFFLPKGFKACSLSWYSLDLKCVLKAAAAEF